MTTFRAMVFPFIFVLTVGHGAPHQEPEKKQQTDTRSSSVDVKRQAEGQREAWTQVILDRQQPEDKRLAACRSLSLAPPPNIELVLKSIGATLPDSKITPAQLQRVKSRNSWSDWFAKIDPERSPQYAEARRLADQLLNKEISQEELDRVLSRLRVISKTSNTEWLVRKPTVATLDRLGATLRDSKAPQLQNCLYSYFFGEDAEPKIQRGPWREKAATLLAELSEDTSNSDALRMLALKHLPPHIRTPESAADIRDRVYAKLLFDKKLPIAEQVATQIDAMRFALGSDPIPASEKLQEAILARILQPYQPSTKPPVDGLDTGDLRVTLTYGPITEFPPEAIKKTMLDALKDQNPALRANARDLLMRVAPGDTQTVKRVLSTPTTAPVERGNKAAALSNARVLQPEILEFATGIALDPKAEPYELQHAMRAIGAMGSGNAKAISALRGLLRRQDLDPQVKERAEAALSNIE